MANRDGRVSLQQHERQRFPYNIAAPQHHCAFAFDTDTRGLDHLNHALRRAGFKYRIALDQPAEIIRMKSIGIFLRGYRFQHHPAVDVLGQRQLDQNSMDFGIRVFLFNQGQQIRLRG